MVQVKFFLCFSCFLVVSARKFCNYELEGRTLNHADDCDLIKNGSVEHFCLIANKTKFKLIELENSSMKNCKKFTVDTTGVYTRIIPQDFQEYTGLRLYKEMDGDEIAYEKFGNEFLLYPKFCEDLSFKYLELFIPDKTINIIIPLKITLKMDLNVKCYSNNCTWNYPGSTLVTVDGKNSPLKDVYNFEKPPKKFTICPENLNCLCKNFLYTEYYIPNPITTTTAKPEITTILTTTTSTISTPKTTTTKLQKPKKNHKTTTRTSTGSTSTTTTTPMPKITTIPNTTSSITSSLRTTIRKLQKITNNYKTTTTTVNKNKIETSSTTQISTTSRTVEPPPIPAKINMYYFLLLLIIPLIFIIFLVIRFRRKKLQNYRKTSKQNFKILKALPKEPEYESLLEKNYTNPIKSTNLQNYLLDVLSDDNFLEDNILVYEYKKITSNCEHRNSLYDITNKMGSLNLILIENFMVIKHPTEYQMIELWKIVEEQNITNIITLINIYTKLEVFEYWQNYQNSRNTIVVQKLKTPNGKQINHIVFEYGKNYITDFTLLLMKILLIPVNKEKVLLSCSGNFELAGSIILADYSLRMAAKNRIVDLPKTMINLDLHKKNLMDKLEDYLFAYLLVADCISSEEYTIKENIMKEIQTSVRQKGLSAFLHLEKLSKLNKILEHIFEQWKLDCEDEKMREKCLWIYKVLRQLELREQPNIGQFSKFWVEVFEANVDCVVCLNETLSDNSIRYWPSEEILDVDSIQVIFQKSIEMDFYRLINVSLSYDNYSKIVTILMLKKWDAARSLPMDKIALIKLWEAVVKFSKPNEKIIVTCNDGILACGIFAALPSIFKQLHEEKLDIIQVVRMIRFYNPEFIRDLDQLYFLYAIAGEYYKTLTN